MGRRFSSAPSSPGSIPDEPSYELTMEVDRTEEDNYKSSTMDDTTVHTWRYLPFKQQILQMEIDGALIQNIDHNMVISKLCDMGIKVYLLMHDSTDLKRDLIKMMEDASYDDSATIDFNRCCLFKDENGRVFNTILAGSATGLSSAWAVSTSMFSGLNATIVMFTLVRSLALLPGSGDLGYGPLYLAVFVGSVLKEETSHSWLSSQLYISGTPSISSVALGVPFAVSDVPRYLSIIALILAGASAGTSNQYIFALIGVSSVIAAISANLGGRAWKNAGFGRIRYSGPGSAAAAYIVAIAAGILAPVLGFRELEAGGRAALEKSLFLSFMVAVAYVASGIEPIQSYVVMGENDGNLAQAITNVTVGVCWLVNTVSCLAMSPLIKAGWRDSSDDRFLVKDENSPVGYRVPCLPNYYIEPHMISKPFLELNENFVKAAGSFLTVAIGGGIICTGLFYPISNVGCSILNLGCSASA